MSAPIIEGDFKHVSPEQAKGKALGNTPRTDAYPTALIERAIQEALHPKGMSVHDGKVTLQCDHVQRILFVSRTLEAELLDFEQRLHEVADDRKRISAELKESAAIQDAQDAKWYYLQDSRSYVGNDVLWWARAGGYTTDLDKAQVYSEEGAKSQQRMRETDIPWLKAYVDGKSRPAVDMQYIKQSDAAMLTKDRT